jgi:hypothetical protein
MVSGCRQVADIHGPSKVFAAKLGIYLPTIMSRLSCVTLIPLERSDDNGSAVARTERRNYLHARNIIIVSSCARDMTFISQISYQLSALISRAHLSTEFLSAINE